MRWLYEALGSRQCLDRAMRKQIKALALFDLAIDSKLRGYDLVQLRISQLVLNAAARYRERSSSRKLERRFSSS